MEEQKIETQDRVNILYKYIQIIEMDSSVCYKRPVKTKVFRVINHVYNCNLGWIKWNTGWRRYAFYPEENTYYEEVCLGDISKFLEELNSSKKGEEVKTKV